MINHNILCESVNNQTQMISQPIALKETIWQYL